MANVERQDFDKLQEFLNTNLVYLFRNSRYISIKIERVHDHSITILGNNITSQSGLTNQMRIRITRDYVDSNISPGRFAYNPSGMYLGHKEGRERKLGKFKKILQVSNDHMKTYENGVREKLADFNREADHNTLMENEFSRHFEVATSGARGGKLISRNYQYEPKRWGRPSDEVEQLPLVSFRKNEDETYTINRDSGFFVNPEEFQFNARHLKELGEFLERVLFDKEHMTELLEEDDD